MQGQPTNMEKGKAVITKLNLSYSPIKLMSHMFPLLLSSGFSFALLMSSEDTRTKATSLTLAFGFKL